MKTKELNAARRLITKVLAKPSIGPSHRDRLHKAKRELDKVAQSGKLERDCIFRIVELVSAVLLEVIEADNVVR